MVYEGRGPDNIRRLYVTNFSRFSTKLIIEPDANVYSIPGKATVNVCTPIDDEPAELGVSCGFWRRNITVYVTASSILVYHGNVLLEPWK